MKAYHVLMFLMIFNMFFWVVTVGLGIYNVGFGGETVYDLDRFSTVDLIIEGFFSLTGNIGFDIVSFAGLLAGAAIVGWILAQQSVLGVVLGTFSWFFWTSFKNSMTLLYNMSNQSIGVFYVIVIFGVIAGGIFFVGLAQLATQSGWSAFE